MHDLQANIFYTLPSDMIGEIFGYLKPVELIFRISRVCKECQRISFILVWEQYEPIIKRFELMAEQLTLDDLGQFLICGGGKKFIKFMLRQSVFELATAI